MYFFAFNLEKFTPDRNFYTGSARGARDNYEVCLCPLDVVTFFFIHYTLIRFGTLEGVEKVTLKDALLKICHMELDLTQNLNKMFEFTNWPEHLVF